MEHFLSVAKGNLVHFHKGWACNTSQKLIIKYDMHTNALDGYAVQLKELKNAVKLLGSDLQLIGDSLYVISGSKKKKLATEKSFYEEKEDTTLPTLISNKFYDRFVVASKYISEDSTRYMLCGVCLSPLGGVWATDGKHMIAYHDDEELAIGKEIVIPYVSSLANLKVKKIFCHDNSMEFVTMQGIHYFVSLIQSQFPNCKKLLENVEGFNPIELSSDVCKSLLFAEKFLETKSKQVKVTNKGLVTICSEPYTDAWEIEQEFSFDCNLVMMNRCLADISAPFRGNKEMMFKTNSNKIFFEDSEKVTMFMPYIKA